MADEEETGKEKEGRRTTVADFEMDCVHCGKKMTVTELIPAVKKGGQKKMDLGVEEPGDEVQAK